VTIGPDMITCGGVNELRRDADAISALAHATFQNVTHAKLARSAFHVDGLALVCEGRVARHHKEPPQFRKAGDDIFGNAIGKMLRFRVAAHVDKWERRDRWTIAGARFRSLFDGIAFCSLSQLNSMNANRARDVLDDLLTHILKAEA